MSDNPKFCGTGQPRAYDSALACTKNQKRGQMQLRAIRDPKRLKFAIYTET